VLGAEAARALAGALPFPGHRRGNRVSENERRFRSRAEPTQALTRAGYMVERVFGHWDRRPPCPGTPEIIVVAVCG
jgi:hypothetical protein